MSTNFNPQIAEISVEPVGADIMKPLWNMRRQSAPARATRHRVGRALMRVVMAGAVSLPIPSQSAVLNLPRTGGAVIQAWAFGTLSAAKRPDSQYCDLSHVCELAISSAGGAGTGTGTTIKTSFQSSSQGEPPPDLPFTLTETIDYSHPVNKSVHGDNGHGACYPGSGVMTIPIDASSTLVLDIVGQFCQVGPSSAQLVFIGSYASDAASTGKVADADGIGTVNIWTPSGLPGTGTNMKASLVGQLKYGN
jgi:hypothetical protein